MKQKILGFLGAVLVGISCMGVMGVASEPAYAVEVTAGGKNNCTSTPLGFRPWYYGATLCENGNIKMPAKGDESALVNFIWAIVLNISFDLSLAVGYLAVAMVIYGGYMYIMAQGDPNKAAKGQHTLTSAVIGVVIAMGASVIVNTLQIVLGLNNAGALGAEYTTSQIQGIFSWAYAMAGLVAVVFIIKGGVEYVISRGDPGRVQKATRSLTYAIAGLIIVILASVITSVVMGAVGGAL